MGDAMDEEEAWLFELLQYNRQQVSEFGSKSSMLKGACVCDSVWLVNHVYMYIFIYIGHIL